MNYSTLIYTYDITSMEVKKKDGKYQWYVVTKMMDGWKLVIVNVENSKNMMDPFKYFQIQFYLDPLLMIPMSGIGDIKDIPCTISREYYWDVDISNLKSVLVNFYVLILDQVRAWSVWFMGGESQELSISNYMVIKAVYPNQGNNQGLFNRYKSQLRRLSGAVCFIAKNHIKCFRYNPFYPCKEIFEYIHEVTGCRILCGLIFLKLMMTLMKPQLYVEHRSK